MTEGAPPPGRARAGAVGILRPIPASAQALNVNLQRSGALWGLGVPGVATGARTAAPAPIRSMTGDAPATILVVEDDAATRTFLADNLTADGYELLVAENVQHGLRLLETKFPDLALVDLGLPDASGFELLRRVREADGVVSRVDPATPLVLLTGRDGELDRVRGFERGADDYICKPFSYPELRGRLAALLRRADHRRRTGRLRIGALDIDPQARTAR